MENTVLRVDGMSCEHCVKAIKNAVGAIPGVASVLVDLNAKTVGVDYDPTQSPLDRIKMEIEDQDYDVVG